MNAADYFCSTLSLEAHEPLYGSAPEKQVWFLLQVDRPWGAQALPDSDLPDPLKAHISGALSAIPGSNILFIRQPGQPRTGIAFFVALAYEQNPRLYAFTLNSYADLLALDLAAIVRGDTAYESHRSDEALYLVCTNAKRDKCCAKYGVGIYQALQAIVPSQSWQCSHIGGHRFAPTSLFLPHGICYGRIAAANIPAMVAANRVGDLFLPHLRGRVYYDGPAQAADYLLRAQLGITQINGLQLVSKTSEEANCWDMQFDASGTIHNIRLQKNMTDVEIFTSCFDDKKAPVADYRLI